MAESNRTAVPTSRFLDVFSRLEPFTATLLTLLDIDTRISLSHASRALRSAVFAHPSAWRHLRITSAPLPLARTSSQAAITTWSECLDDRDAEVTNSSHHERRLLHTLLAQPELAAAPASFDWISTLDFDGALLEDLDNGLTLTDFYALLVLAAPGLHTLSLRGARLGCPRVPFCFSVVDDSIIALSGIDRLNNPCGILLPALTTLRLWCIEHSLSGALITPAVVSLPGLTVDTGECALPHPPAAASRRGFRAARTCSGCSKTTTVPLCDDHAAKRCCRACTRFWCADCIPGRVSRVGAEFVSAAHVLVPRIPRAVCPACVEEENQKPRCACGAGWNSLGEGGAWGLDERRAPCACGRWACPRCDAAEVWKRCTACRGRACTECVIKEVAIPESTKMQMPESGAGRMGEWREGYWAGVLAARVEVVRTLWRSEGLQKEKGMAAWWGENKCCGTWYCRGCREADRGGDARMQGTKGSECKECRRWVPALDDEEGIYM